MPDASNIPAEGVVSSLTLFTADQTVFDFRAVALRNNEIVMTIINKHAYFEESDLMLIGGIGRVDGGGLQGEVVVTASQGQYNPKKTIIRGLNLQVTRSEVGGSLGNNLRTLHGLPVPE